MSRARPRRPDRSRCRARTPVASDAGDSKNLFWDAIHPTAAAHGNLAIAALAAIPEPGTATLLLLGLLVLASRRGRAAR